MKGCGVRFLRRIWEQCGRKKKPQLLIPVQDNNVPNKMPQKKNWDIKAGI